MAKEIRKILVVNAGSSSLKYMLFDMKGEKMLCKGLVERIGIDAPRLVYQKAGAEKIAREIAAPDHAAALKSVVEAISDKENGVIASLKEIDAIGHRMLHGAEVFKDSVKVDAKVLKECKKLIPFGPLHMPPNIGGVEACQKIFKGVPNVVVFDTAFHQTMPECAFLYAVAPEFYRKNGIRKYGFHGTSHKFVTQAAAKFLKKPLTKVNLVTCHLGNGSSLAAIKNGEVIDTTMGLTPLAGLIMGTRTGDIDVAAAIAIAKIKRLTLDELDTFLNKKSGLEALTGSKGGDMRDICSKAEKGDLDAIVALEMFGHRTALYVGGYNTLVGGADAIIMTGGIGENSSEGREQIVKRLGALGIKLDKKANAKIHGEIGVISTKDSKIPVVVLPTNEELMIARDTMRVLKTSKKA
ncbi:MAG: acetate kinase [Kiritimatiellae bacterium]|nr:acetate kinase [Kiritimatiellia bacterium]